MGENKMNRVLILSGKVASEHNMTEMNRDLKLMLEATGEFQVRATEEFNGATERTLEGYDMILLNYDGKDKPTDRYQTLEPGAEKVFFDFVREGGGLYIHHSSCWLEDGLPEEYYKLWGYYLTMPYSRKVPQDDFCVHPVGNDPIVRGLSRQILAPGDDFFAGIQKCSGTEPEVVLAAFDDIDAYRVPGWPPKHHPVDIPDGKLEHMRGVNTDTPIAWKHRYGKGRVFGCSIGHGIDTYHRFDYITMFVRACQWCCGKEVTLNKPDRTGENRFRPWPYY
ncbi:MAG: ThuA domain-containing protein [Bilifractor sp.]|nr:ThuA domain-containing protein [Bilifractor sp.]